MGQFQDAWRCGQVVRKHTMENIRAENIAEHTWGVVLLLLMVWPTVPMRIVVAAQVHDMGERATGDMPGPTKWANPVLEREMDRLEHEHLDNTLPDHLRKTLGELVPAEWAVVEFFDRADFCMSMIRERKMGNLYSMIYFGRALEKMKSTLMKNLEDFREIDNWLPSRMNCLHQEITSEYHHLVEGLPDVS